MQIITLTTDFGTVDPSAGVMKGVILEIYPYAKLIDLTHEISPQNIWQANWTMLSACKHFPKGTIHVCVVDPGVGSARIPIIIQTENFYFIGPNNGVFSWIVNQEKIKKVIEISEKKYWLPKVSHTFHGRDIFAPVAAHLAKGTNINDFGIPLVTDDLIVLPDSSFIKKDKSIIGVVRHIDHFGNIITNIPNEEVPDKLKGKVKGKSFGGLIKSYTEGSQNQLNAIRGSHGFLEISVYLGNATKFVSAMVGDKVEIKF